jgi:hypothetical protein
MNKEKREKFLDVITQLKFGFFEYNGTRSACPGNWHFSSC